MKSKLEIWALGAVLLFGAAGVHAQDQQQDPRAVNPTAPLPPISSAGKNTRPAPAARGVSGPDDYEEPATPAQTEPDTHTLAGAEVFTVGSAGTARNIFDPSFSVTGLADSGATNSAGQPVLGPAEIIGGQLNFNRSWDRYRLTASYNGGETFYQTAQPNSSFHDATVEQEIDWQRWRLNLRDDFLASPGASFGGTGMGGPGLTGEFAPLLGSGLQSIGETFVPSETIQTGQAMRYRNAALAEAEYSFNRRSAFSFSGSYGLLHFTDAGYVSSHDLNAQAGYDYLLDPKNSIAVLGGYGKIDYTGVNISTQDYMAAFAYGRKITGRLAFQAAAGPEQIRSAGTSNGSFQFWTWAAKSALTYERRRTQYAVSYTRGMANGSGVFFGSTTNTVGGSMTHQFTRKWTATANGGYAFNRTIAPAGVATSTFNNWFIGANASRQVGHHVRVSFNYGLLKQDTVAACPVTSCGVSGYEQTFGMSVNWHLRPTE